jgi:spore maturation protein SpmA
MLHIIWLIFIVSAFLASLYQVIILGQIETFSEVMQSISAMAKLSVEIAIGLIGLLAFWLGIFQVAEQSG